MHLLIGWGDSRNVPFTPLQSAWREPWYYLWCCNKAPSFNSRINVNPLLTVQIPLMEPQQTSGNHSFAALIYAKCFDPGDYTPASRLKTFLLSSEAFFCDSPLFQDMLESLHLQMLYLNKAFCHVSSGLLRVFFPIKVSLPIYGSWSLCMVVGE